jgi:UDP-N-acetylmuramoyl-tripeptide--D-alanyl-D-alanine ligase
MKRTLAEFARAVGGVLQGVDAEFINATIDTRKLAAGDLFFALPGEHLDGHDFVAAAAAAAAAGAVVTRRMPLDLPQIIVGDVAQALTAAAVVWRAQFSIPVIGVAGSNGKTTVKEMLAAILTRAGSCLSTAGNLNNHLGVPLTLLRLSSVHRSAVIEIGANRAGEVATLAALVQPTVGLITNAGAEHLEGFGDLEGVARAEGEMVAALKEKGVAVINADDAFAPMWRRMTPARVVSFGLSESANVRAANISQGADERGFVTRFQLRSRSGSVDVELALAGEHNVRNAACAAAAAQAAGSTLSDVAAGLRTMRAVSGRLQFRRTANGAWLIDDSYNANPTSVSAALDVLAGLAGRRWMVLGDMAELGEHSAESHRAVGIAARERGVERLYTFGKLAALAAESFRTGADASQSAHSFDDSDALVQTLNAALSPEVRLLVKGSRVNRLERVVASMGAVPPVRAVG